ncbi:MAG TPA: spore coat protein [Syntrophomonadaceae bacterium]|nr:spore coat protein [Syntrophomonadaceae bacterium]
MLKHLSDKEMVNDVLSQCKSSLTTYTTSITECSNQQLRQTLQQIRNSDEQFQYQLYQMAEQKGFYRPASDASSQDIQMVKSQLSQA